MIQSLKKNIDNFISKATRNQDRKSITTDLKQEYRGVINHLWFKHQYCRFHVQKKLNKDIRDYIKINKVSKDEEKEIRKYKQEINDILNSETYDLAHNKLEILKNKIEELPEIIGEIIMDFVSPYLRNLTFCLEDENIESTTNKIENCFQKIFPKHIKRLMKTEKGIVTRIALKISYWNSRNRVDF